MTRHLLLAALLGSSAALMTGCGGSGSEPASAETAALSAAADPGGGTVAPAPPSTAAAPLPGAAPAPASAPGQSSPAPSAAPAPAPAPAPAGQAPVPALAAGSAELPMRRLTRTQYINTLQDVARQMLPAQGAALAAAIPALAANVPPDAIVPIVGERHGGFQRLDQVVSQGHVDAIHEVASRMGQEFTLPARFGALMGTCATDTSTTNDDSCVRDFIRKFGRAAFRRPLTDAEVTAVRQAAGSTPVAATSVADVITLMLAMPQTAYMVESGSATVQGGRSLLTAHELAARLSYHFWQSPPDRELASLADNGQLLTPATFAAQVARLAADTRTDASIREFFVQWFRLNEIEPLDSRLGDPVFDAFRGAFAPTAATKQNVIDEIGDLATWLAKSGAPLRGLLTDRRSFARTADVAALYGVPVWNGSTEPPAWTDPARTGLLSRVAFLATGSANTRPIIKGYRIRSALLCQSLPPPPAGALAVSVDLSPTLSTREVVERLTEQPNSSCIGCHTAMNPLGFASENFDALGRTRSTQRLFSATGQVIDERPVRTDGQPRITSTDERRAAGLAEVTQYIAQSGEFERCFAQQYFRFTFARVEQEGDRAAVTDVMDAARAGASMRDVMARIALRPEFQSKLFP